MDIDKLKTEFPTQLDIANRLRESIVEQLYQLFKKRGITLGVPIESRTKSWASIEDKINRKELVIEKFSELDDFVGIRVILLFLRDLTFVGKLLSETFNVLSVEDTGARLTETQFGYQSQHYIVQIPETWSRIPSFSDLCALKAEIQVRTMSQHIWAAASHKLQYKQEKNVPPPLRRTIHRVSALLETVDLEFERILEGRRQYVENDIIDLKPSEPLNVDLVASILQELLPSQNKHDSEPYSELLSDLLHFKIDTATKLRDLIQGNLTAMLREESTILKKRKEEKDYTGTSKERTDMGVYFTYVGLTRQALREKFGDKVFSNYLRSLTKKDKKSS